MKPIEELLPDALLGAIDLSAVVGGSSRGWMRDDALRVVDQAERAHVAILGGDVWLSVDGALSSTYDNWFVTGVGIKPTQEDVVRYAEKARRYVSSYKLARRGEAVFEFVFGETALGY